jgi:outer membrane protein OmpA-like peptidoglycan-associated protein
MRPLPIFQSIALAMAVSAGAAAYTPASAQVTVDLHALQALPDSTSAPPSIIRRAPVRRNTRAEPISKPVASNASPTQQPVPAAPQPALPEATPQTASIAPIPPPAATAPPPPPPISAAAGTTAAPTKAGLRLTFTPDQSDLTPDSAAAIKQLTGQITASDSTTYNIRAYAHGKPDDPSTARRLSLSRAMAVRAALVADGVPSPRIFVRALGAQSGDPSDTAPVDRVDLDVEGATTAQAAGK